MKTASPDLISLLATSPQLWMADLFTFTLIDGTVIRYTSSDADVTHGGRTFLHTGPIIKRSRTRTVIGVATDTLDLDVSVDASHTLYGQPFMQAVCNGALDGATVELERAFSGTPGAAVVGTVLLFVGRVSDIDASSMTAKLIVRSHLELLDTPMPRNLYQPPCGYSVYDTGCGASKAAFGVNATASSGSTRQVINCSLPNPNGYFNIGEIVFTSGQNAGVRRTVRDYTVGVANLSYPLPRAVSVGDAFIAYPGCDKRMTTCETKFSNLARFRATPFVPKPESAL